MAGGSIYDSTTASQNSAASLDGINEKFLRLICHHLEILDIVNLATTCKKLLYFAEIEIFPKIAQEIQITMIAEDDILFINTSNTESGAQ